MTRRSTNAYMVLTIHSGLFIRLSITSSQTDFVDAAVFIAVRALQPLPYDLFYDNRSIARGPGYSWWCGAGIEARIDDSLFWKAVEIECDHRPVAVTTTARCSGSAIAVLIPLRY